LRTLLALYRRPARRGGHGAAQSPAGPVLSGQQQPLLRIHRVPRAGQVAGGGGDRPAFQWPFCGLYLLRPRAAPPQPRPFRHPVPDRGGPTRWTACGVPRVLDPQLPVDELQDVIPTPGNAVQPALGAYQLVLLSLWFWLLPAFQAQLLNFFASLILKSRTAAD